MVKVSLSQCTIQHLQEEQVLQLGPELSLIGVTREDAGLYYCVANNVRGLVNKSLDLEVYCKSHFPSEMTFMLNI